MNPNDIQIALWRLAWTKVDPYSKFFVTLVFWSVFGFWAFYLISEYSVFGYAVFNDVRLPAEGVPFLGPLGGFFYIFCMLIFILFSLIINPARYSLHAIRGPLIQPVSRFEVWGVISLILYALILSLIGYLVSGAKAILFVAVVPTVGFLLYGLVRAEEFWSQTIVRTAIIIVIFVLCAVGFSYRILNGTLLYQVGYGGNRPVSVHLKQKEGCDLIHDGLLMIRSKEFISLGKVADVAGIIEIPMSGVCKITYR